MARTLPFPESALTDERSSAFADAPREPGCAMTLAAVSSDDPDRASGLSHALNFRDILAEEREQVARVIASRHGERTPLVEEGDTRALEAELMYLDGLIADIDRRLGWSRHPATNGHDVRE